jgi:hypothetical protein
MLYKLLRRYPLLLLYFVLDEIYKLRNRTCPAMHILSIPCTDKRIEIEIVKASRNRGWDTEEMSIGSLFLSDYGTILGTLHCLRLI